MKQNGEVPIQTTEKETRRHCLESVERISSLPFINTTITLTTGLYGKVKGSSMAGMIVCESVEHSAHKAVLLVEPVVDTLEKPIKIADKILCGTIDFVGANVPNALPIKTATDKVVHRTMNFVSTHMPQVIEAPTKINEMVYGSMNFVGTHMMPKIMEVPLKINHIVLGTLDFVDTHMPKVLHMKNAADEMIHNAMSIVGTDMVPQVMEVPTRVNYMVLGTSNFVDSLIPPLLPAKIAPLQMVQDTIDFVNTHLPQVTEAPKQIDKKFCETMNAVGDHMLPKLIEAPKKVEDFVNDVKEASDKVSKVMSYVPVQSAVECVKVLGGYSLEKAQGVYNYFQGTNSPNENVNVNASESEGSANDSQNVMHGNNPDEVQS